MDGGARELAHGCATERKRDTKFAFLMHLGISPSSFGQP
jgi:hypothetical protein